MQMSNQEMQNAQESAEAETQAIFERKRSSIFQFFALSRPMDH